MKLNITEPTLLLDNNKCLANIRAMAEKAKKNDLILRPHFKTHQSREIGRWFRPFGVNKITVSSLKMAEYFAEDGWTDITVAFPVNVLEMERINALAGKIQLNLLVESVEAVKLLLKGLIHPVALFLKIDTGNRRTGINPNNKTIINAILEIIEASNLLEFKGFLSHAGHSYKSNGKEAIKKVHQESKRLMVGVKQAYLDRYPGLIASIGDTPSCSTMDDFDGIDEIRPGNYVFYDLTQWGIGACTLDEIAVALACPVVAKHSDRSEIVVYGGGVHFSKDRALFPNSEDIYFGLVV